MIIYEVTLTVSKSIAKEYSEWLPYHIHEMLKIEGINSAEWFEIKSSEQDSIIWCVHYRMTDMNALNNYLSNHAEGLRADGVRRFPGQFTATRRILQMLSIKS